MLDASWSIVRRGHSFFVQSAPISNSISLVISAIRTRRPPRRPSPSSPTCELASKNSRLSPMEEMKIVPILNRVHVNYRPLWLKIPCKIWPLYFSFRWIWNFMLAFLCRGRVTVSGRENVAIVFGLTATKYGSFRDTLPAGSEYPFVPLTYFKIPHVNRNSWPSKNLFLNLSIHEFFADTIIFV